MLKKMHKPYQLVWVSEPSVHAACERFEYVGQLMSFVTPDDTIMVRRVPGHPGTLVEMPMSQITILSEKETSKMRHVSYATVGGRGAFPVDMLRYDNCAPVNFKLEETEIGVRAVAYPGTERDGLMVAKVCDSGLPTMARWTPERWSSFLWGFRELGSMPIGDD